MRRVAASAAQRLTEVRARWRAFLLDQGFNGGPEDSLDDPPGTELKPLIPRGLTWLVFRCCARRPRRVRSAHAATQYRVHAPYMAKSPRARCLHAWVAAYTLLRGSAQGTSLHPPTTPTSVPTISSPVSLTGSPRNHKDLYGSLCECVGSCWIGWLQVFVLVMHKLIHLSGLVGSSTAPCGDVDGFDTSSPGRTTLAAGMRLRTTLRTVRQTMFRTSVRLREASRVNTSSRRQKRG